MRDDHKQSYNKFIKEDIWNIKTSELSAFKRFWIYFLRIFSVTQKIFYTTQLQQGAATLTYYTLLGFVPMLVILLGVARGFSQENIVVEALFQKFGTQQEVITQVIDIARNALSELNTGLVSTVGIIVLLWSVIRILKNLEISLNNIFDVKKRRSLIRQFSDYLAMILFSPIVFIIANTLSFIISAKVAAISKESVIFSEIHPLLFVFYNILSFFLTSSLFTFIYIFMPNTRVRFLPALFAGFIASFVYQIVQIAYIALQIRVTQHNAIYGTFAAIPLFLMWTHLSWVILLLGAKVAFALQNIEAYELISDDFKLSQRFEKILSLRIIKLCVDKFLKSKPAPSVIEISKQLSIPLFITQQIIENLKEIKLISEVKKSEDDLGYYPAIDPSNLTIKRVIDMIELKGEEPHISISSEYKTIIKSLEKFDRLIEKSDANLPIKDL